MPTNYSINRETRFWSRIALKTWLLKDEQKLMDAAAWLWSERWRRRKEGRGTNKSLGGGGLICAVCLPLVQ